MPQFSHADFNILINETVDNIHRLSKLKGGEYAGDDDRLNNFRRNGAALKLPMETVWAVYAGKHWDAIQQYIVDLREGKTRQRMESISGRADDLIVYAILFKAMVVEREREADAADETDRRHDASPAQAEATKRFAEKVADAPTISDEAWVEGIQMEHEAPVLNAR
jgi:hypothetical protein